MWTLVTFALWILQRSYNVTEYDIKISLFLWNSIVNAELTCCFNDMKKFNVYSSDFWSILYMYSLPKRLLMGRVGGNHDYPR